MEYGQTNDVISHMTLVIILACYAIYMYMSYNCTGHDCVVCKKCQDLVTDILLQEADLQRDSLDTTADYTYMYTQTGAIIIPM